MARSAPGSDADYKTAVSPFVLSKNVLLGEHLHQFDDPDILPEPRCLAMKIIQRHSPERCRP